MLTKTCKKRFWTLSTTWSKNRYIRFRLNNTVQYCWQLWTIIRSAKHCSIPLQSRLIVGKFCWIKKIKFLPGMINLLYFNGGSSSSSSSASSAVADKERRYLTNRFHFCVRLYCNRSQMTSWRVKNKKVRTRRSRVSDFVLHTLWHHLWSITVQKHKKMKSICFIL